MISFLIFLSIALPLCYTQRKDLTIWQILLIIVPKKYEQIQPMSYGPIYCLPLVHRQTVTVLSESDLSVMFKFRFSTHLLTRQILQTLSLGWQHLYMIYMINKNTLY